MLCSCCLGLLNYTKTVQDKTHRVFSLKKDERYIFFPSTHQTSLDEEINGRFSQSAELIIQLSHLRYQGGGDSLKNKIVIITVDAREISNKKGRKFRDDGASHTTKGESFFKKKRKTDPSVIG